MIISDLNYLETIAEGSAIVGGGPLSFIGELEQYNYNSTDQDADASAYINAFAVTQSDVNASAYNTNNTFQNNSVSQFGFEL